MAYLDPLTCGVAQNTPAVGNAFTVYRTFTFNSSTVRWSFFVKVAGPGKVTVSQSGGKALVIGGSNTTRRPGEIRLALRPTTAGHTLLGRTGSLKVKLKVTYAPTGGRPAAKTLAVTLKK
jgi:hypothetical protein